MRSALIVQVCAEQYGVICGMTEWGNGSTAVWGNGGVATQKRQCVELRRISVQYQLN